MTKEELYNYYIVENHSITQCCEYFNISKTTLCRNIKKFELHKDKKDAPKPVNTRSHESYIAGGKKSAETQRENWKNKSEEEKKAWSEKMRESHSSNEYRSLRASLSHEFFLTLDADTVKYRNKLRSEALKNFWESLTDEEKQKRVQKSLDGGAGWNYDTIQKTNIERYGVPNQYMRADIAYSHTHSKPNEEFYELLLSSGFDADNIEREFPIGNRAYDFKIGNALIEINPYATHNSTWGIYDKPTAKTYHSTKTKLAVDNGYRCINVWDWDDKNKVINLLIPRYKIYARNCTIQHVNVKDARNFINNHHLQGYANDEIRLGLYYNNELVSIMTFGKPRYNKKYEYELIRYCSSYTIVGGAEKLFKNFTKEYNPSSVISYCDLSKFTGETYLKLGFKFIKSTVGKHWYNPKTGKHVTDNLLRQRGFDQLFGTNYGKGTSNKELMIDAGFVEIYDAGQASYLYISK